MLSGINTDIEYSGKVYHVQTEDRGIDNPILITQLFLGGAIISSKKTSYADILKADCLNDVVRDLMREQHRSMIKELLSGKFSLDTKEGEKEIEKNLPAARLPSRQGQTGPPAVEAGKASDKKGLDDVIIDYLSSKEEKG